MLGDIIRGGMKGPHLNTSQVTALETKTLVFQHENEMWLDLIWGATEKLNERGSKRQSFVYAGKDKVLQTKILLSRPAKLVNHYSAFLYY